MKKTALLVAAIVSLAPLTARAAETKVPAGKETLILDSTCKAKEAAGKKVLKGPVPFAHQRHADAGVACTSCHHKQPEGETAKPCHACHQLIKSDTPKEADAFHCGSVESSPAPWSCIGCHKETVSGSKADTVPMEREPCQACHSILKK